LSDIKATLKIEAALLYPYMEKLKNPEGVDWSKKFVQRILSGDRGACGQFVADYTDMVMYKILELMKSHCSYSARDYVCCLHFLHAQKKGRNMSTEGRAQCDECMDYYIWFFEYLKGKLKAYKGINNCTLKTFVWSIINSHSTYVDWLRWKYGRVV